MTAKTSLRGGVLVVDNYDSFTYNLVQYLGELGARTTVVRNDALTAAEVVALGPSAILLSPGPGRPEDAGMCVELVHGAVRSRIPLFGVCLGHQAIAQAFGAAIVGAPSLMHGRTSDVLHAGGGVFAALPSPLRVARYHSLVAAPDSLPPELVVTAWTADGTVMAIRHRSHHAEGVQFHPESIGTARGRELLAAFLDEARVPRAVAAPA